MTVEALAVVIWSLAGHMRPDQIEDACDHLVTLPVAEQEGTMALLGALRDHARGVTTS